MVVDKVWGGSRIADGVLKARHNVSSYLIPLISTRSNDLHVRETDDSLQMAGRGGRMEVKNGSDIVHMTFGTRSKLPRMSNPTTLGGSQYTCCRRQDWLSLPPAIGHLKISPALSDQTKTCTYHT